MMMRVLTMVSCLALMLMPSMGQDEDSGKLKSGVVNIQTLFRGYHKTLKAQEQINTERAKIQKQDNELRQRVKMLDVKLRDMTRKLHDEGLGESERKQTSQAVGLLFQERESLERSRRAGIQNRHQELNRKMIARMKGILVEIRGVIQESAEREGYDLIFDVEGENTAQVPFLLYAKEATDITAMIQKELSKTAPAE